MNFDIMKMGVYFIFTWTSTPIFAKKKLIFLWLIKWNTKNYLRR